MNLSAAASPARILAGAIIALLVAAATAPPAAAVPPPRAGIWVRHQDLPRRVRETIDRERGRSEVKQIIEFRIENRVYYRVLIDERGADRAIVVSDFGRVLAANEVPDLPTGRGSFEKPVAYEQLPAEVRRTLDNERGRNPVRSIQFVRRDNREFYRCIVDTRGDDLAIRINSIGKLLSIDEVEDIAVGNRESSRFDSGRERAVAFDDCPLAVRRVIERERDRRPIKQIVFCDRNGRQFYRVIIDDRAGDRVLRVGEDGYLYDEKEVPDIAVGPGGWDKNRWGHEARMRYEDLPWAIQTTLDRERRGRPVKEIIYVRRFSSSFYRCIIDTRGDDTAIRIGDDGALLSREQVEDTAFGREEVRQAPPREEWIRFNDLPGAVRFSLDRHRGGHPVLKVLRVTNEGRTYFRCTIDTRPWPTTLLITEEGRVLGT